MRIVGGAWRGRALIAPAGHHTRPTAERARQSLFDMLLHAPWGGSVLMREANVLDAFAGTGALGLEALSRGAAAATFVESDRAALTALRANIAACRADRTTIIAGDATAPWRPGPPFGLIFLDPPYHHGLVAAAVRSLAAAGRIGAGAVVIAELARDEAIPDVATTFSAEVLAERVHGAAKLVVLRRDAGLPPESR